MHPIRPAHILTNASPTPRDGVDLVTPLLGGVFVLISLILSYALNKIDSSKEFMEAKIENTDKIIFKKMDEDNKVVYKKIEEDNKKFNTYIKNTDDVTRNILKEIDFEHREIDQTIKAAMVVCMVAAILPTTSFFLLYKKVDDLEKRMQEKAKEP
jgi:beta-glucanase (GH16 family)